MPIAGPDNVFSPGRIGPAGKSQTPRCRTGIAGTQTRWGNFATQTGRPGTQNGETGDAKRGDRGRKTGRPGTLFSVSRCETTPDLSPDPHPDRGGGWGDGAGLALKLTGPSPYKQQNRAQRNRFPSYRLALSLAFWRHASETTRSAGRWPMRGVSGQRPCRPAKSTRCGATWPGVGAGRRRSPCRIVCTGCRCRLAADGQRLTAWPSSSSTREAKRLTHDRFLRGAYLQLLPFPRRAPPSPCRLAPLCGGTGSPAGRDRTTPGKPLTPHRPTTWFIPTHARCHLRLAYIVVSTLEAGQRQTHPDVSDAVLVSMVYPGDTGREGGTHRKRLTRAKEASLRFGLSIIPSPPKGDDREQVPPPPPENQTQHAYCIRLMQIT